MNNEMMNNRFQNKIAVITGAASGLGLSITKKLSQENVKLALLDKNANDLSAIQSQLQSENEIYTVDITIEEDVRTTIDKIEKRFGSIDILINCAGITGKTNIKSHEVETENLRTVLDVNFMGSFFTSKYILPLMIKKN